jgi:hypothetical protein
VFLLEASAPPCSVLNHDGSKEASVFITTVITAIIVIKEGPGCADASSRNVGVAEADPATVSTTVAGSVSATPVFLLEASAPPCSVLTNDGSKEASVFITTIITIINVIKEGPGCAEASSRGHLRCRNGGGICFRNASVSS